MWSSFVGLQHLVVVVVVVVVLVLVLVDFNERCCKQLIYRVNHCEVRFDVTLPNLDSFFFF